MRAASSIEHMIAIAAIDTLSARELAQLLNG
jgi:hypothetical protein